MFLDTVNAEKDSYPPWDERPRLDSLSYLFQMGHADVRRWVLDVACPANGPATRALLLARAAAWLRRESDPNAAAVARAARDTVDLLDNSTRDQVCAEIAGVFAGHGANQMTAEWAERITDAERRTGVFASAAVTAATRNDSAAALDFLARLPPSSRNAWAELVAQPLLDRGHYDAANAALLMLDVETSLVVGLAAARVADAMIRAGDLEGAAATLDRGAATVRVEEPNHSLVFAELSYCAARLGQSTRAHELAAAAEEHATTWGPFVHATLAATFTALQEKARAQFATQQASPRFVRCGDCRRTGGDDRTDLVRRRRR
jgi:hypothetical protein